MSIDEEAETQVKTKNCPESALPQSDGGVLLGDTTAAWLLVRGLLFSDGSQFAEAVNCRAPLQ